MANIGSTFTNTESGGWNGARKWRKDAGNGTNTGWVVSEGYATLDASAQLKNGWAVSGGITPTFTRTCSTITFRAILDSTAATDDEFLGNIPGYMINVLQQAPITRGNNDRGLAQLDTNKFRVLRSLASGTAAIWRIGLTWATSNAWPSP